MQDRDRTAFGYALLGLTIGLFLFPWIYLVGVRSETLVQESPWSATFLFAVILLPGLVGYFVGRSKGSNVAV